MLWFARINYSVFIVTSNIPEVFLFFAAIEIITIYNYFVFFEKINVTYW